MYRWILAGLWACAALACTTLTPAERNYRKAMYAKAPDLSGVWAGPKGLRLDFRPINARDKTGYRITVRSDSQVKPTWTIEAGRVEVPVRAGMPWRLRVRVKLPRQKAAPGTITNNQQSIRAELDIVRRRLQFFGSGGVINNQQWAATEGAVQAVRLAATPGEFLQDATLTGPTLKTVKLKLRSYAAEVDCRRLCQKTTRCAAVVTLNKRNCVLKSKVGKPRKRAGAIAWVNPAVKQPVVAPGPPAPGKTLTGWTFSGGDLGRPVRVGKLADCKSKCAKSSKCVGVVFDPKRRECRLKARFQRQQPAKGRVAWAKVKPGKAPKAPQAGQKVKGWTWRAGNLGKARRGSPETICRGDCKRKADCVGYVYRQRGLICQLKKAFPGKPVPAPTAVAWAKPSDAFVEGGCWKRSKVLREEYVDRKGSPKACQARCNAELDRCLGMAWAPLGGYQDRGTCFLYSRVNKGPDPGRSGNIRCRAWEKPKALLEQQRKAVADCRRAQRQPVRAKTPHRACRRHPTVVTGWRLQNVLSFSDSMGRPKKGGLYFPGPFIQVEGGKRVRLRDGKGKGFFLLLPTTPPPGPSSTAKNTVKVHLHYADDPSLVLKRRGKGVVLGPVDRNAEWQLHHGWEYVDYNDWTERKGSVTFSGVNRGQQYVLRVPGKYKFLAGVGGKLGLTDKVESPRAHWRMMTFRPHRFDGGPPTLRGMVCAPKKQQNKLPLVADAPKPQLDDAVVASLARWMVKAYLNAEVPVCWKKGGKGRCADLDPVRRTNCGLSCGKSTEHCVVDGVKKGVAVGEMVASVGSLAFGGGTVGAVKSAVKTGAKMGTKMGMKWAAKQTLKLLSRTVRRALRRSKKKAKRYAKKWVKAKLKRTGQILTTEGKAAVLSASQEGRLTDLIVEQAMDRASMQLTRELSKTDIGEELLDALEAIDPTGVTGVVRAFNDPICGGVPLPRVR